MRKLLFLFALWAMLLNQSPAQVQMDRINVKGINGIWYADQFSGATVNAQILAAAARCGSSACIVVIPSTLGPGTASVGSNVTIMDLRAGDLAGMRVGDFTAYGLGQTSLLATRTYSNPAGTSAAGALSGLTAVTTFSGTSTATRGVGNTTAAVIIAQGVGLTANSSAATLEPLEVNAALAGTTNIDDIQQVVSSPGGVSAANGTVSHWEMFSAIPVFNVPNGLTLSEVIGVRSNWPLNQGPGTGTITNAYTSYMSGPNNYFDGGIAAGSLVLPVVQIQGTSATRTGLLLNAVDTNTNKSVTIDKNAGLHVSSDGITFPGSTSGNTFLVSPTIGANGIVTLPGVSTTLAGLGVTETFTANQALGNSSTLTLASTTIGSLPSAASNPGAMIRVSDSTAVAAEGQTCAGGSSNTALAFSNGTVWKCF